MNTMAKNIVLKIWITYMTVLVPCSGWWWSPVYPVKLFGGNDTAGLVQVQVDGHWGTVCDDSWDDVDAGVVCRQLGLRGGEALSHGPEAFKISVYMEKALRNSPIHFTQLDCVGTEANLFECPVENTEADALSCVHTEDAGVVCEEPLFEETTTSDEIDATTTVPPPEPTKPAQNVQGPRQEVVPTDPILTTRRNMKLDMAENRLTTKFVAERPTVLFSTGSHTVSPGTSLTTKFVAKRPTVLFSTGSHTVSPGTSLTTKFVAKRPTVLFSTGSHTVSPGSAPVATQNTGVRLNYSSMIVLLLIIRVLLKTTPVI